MPNPLRIAEPVNMVRRKTKGAALRELRVSAGFSIEALAEVIKKKGLGEIGTSTIRSIEAGVTTNPGVKTLEQIALGLDQSPADVIAMWLDDPPPEATQRFTKSRFAAMSELFDTLPPGRKVWYDEVLDMVFERMRKG